MGAAKEEEDDQKKKKKKGMMLEMYRKYLRISFKDESMEEKYVETFQLENQKYVASLTICAIIV